MRRIRIETCFAACLLICRFSQHVYACDEQESQAIGLAKEAYQAIKENNKDSITKIVINENDIKTLAKIGNRFGKDLSAETIKNIATGRRRKCLKSLSKNAGEDEKARASMEQFQPTQDRRTRKRQGSPSNQR